MAAPAKIDPELLKYAVSDKERLYLQQSIDSSSMRAAAKELNVNDGTIRQAVERVRARAAKMGYAPDHDLNKPTTAPFVVKGTSTLYGEDGQPKLQWVKTNLDREAQLEIMRQAVEALCEDVKPAKAIPAPIDLNDQLLSVYPWGDPHVGMYAWADEVGEDFDLKIAEQDMYNAVDYLVERSPPSKRGVLINLGDFFHYTNMVGTTERSGHILDRDSRTAKMIDVGVRTIRRCLSLIHI